MLSMLSSTSMSGESVMADKIPYKLGQIMMEMRGAILAAVSHDNVGILNVEAVQQWHEQIKEIVKKNDLENSKPSE